MLDAPSKKLELTNKWLSWKFVILFPMVLFISLCILEITAILHLNDGHLIYSLDDPYIHLSVAENIAEGHYGINSQEYSAPSSSIIWPFLLAPFSATFLFHQIPLIMNILLSLFTIACVGMFLKGLFWPLCKYDRLLTLLTTILFIIGTNMIGLAFTGMEHSLQLLLSVLITIGVLKFSKSGHCSWGLVLLVILGPLVRYEMLALSVPAIWIMIRKKRVKATVVSTIGICLIVGGFAIFLRSHGLGFLPNSVLAKTDIAACSNPIMTVLGNIMEGLTEKRGRGIFLLSMLILFGVFRISGKREKSIAPVSEWIMLAIILHFCFGQFGWFSRYEIYIWASAILAMLYIFVQQCGEQISRLNPLIPMLIVSIFFFFTSLPYVYATIMTPVGCNNVYEQQFQTHRFITKYYKLPVAVNDIGYPSLANEHYILDIWGLGSKEALNSRNSYESAEWMNRLAKRHNVELAIIYNTNYKPDNWIHLANWSISRRRTTISSPTVSVFSLQEQSIDSQMIALRAFSENLPPGVKLEWIYTRAIKPES